jgi:hypothetical protein
MNQEISGPRTLRINSVSPRAPNTKKQARTSSASVISTDAHWFAAGSNPIDRTELNQKTQ